MRRAALVMVVLLLGAACSSNDRGVARTEPTEVSALEGAAITMPSQPSDVRPLLASCLAEAATVGPSLNFTEGCNEAALAADEVGLGEIAADLREMMTTADTAARLVIIGRLQLAIASL